LGLLVIILLTLLARILIRLLYRALWLCMHGDYVQPKFALWLLSRQ